MKIKHIILLLTSIALLAAVLVGAYYVMGNIKDEIDITDTARKVFADFKEKALTTEVTALVGKEQKMAENWSEVKDICFDSMDGILLSYAKGQTDHSLALRAMESYFLFPLNASERSYYLDKIATIENGREAYRRAINETDTLTALPLLCKVSADDEYYYPAAQKKVKEILDIDILRSDSLMKLSRGRTDSTLEFLNTVRTFAGEDSGINRLIEYVELYKENEENTVKYRGQIEILSVRNLMAFPELVYAEDSGYTDTYDSSLITPKEFKAILNELYNRDYILVSINSIGDAEHLSGIDLPVGKKPFALIIEDLTYPSANRGSGVCDMLGIDDAGALCTVTDGKVSYDNESLLILEAFLREHPDFTYKGARGCISLTGYAGIFGYDITTDYGKEQAKRIAELLTDDGWTFASQSYSYADMSKASLETLKWDTEKWENEIEPLVGKAKVYVWPYGSHVRNGEKHSYLHGKGYSIFLGQGVDPYHAAEPDGLGVFFDRRSLTGYALRNYADRYAHLFDSESVIDGVRKEKSRMTNLPALSLRAFSIRTKV
ncbi:MAG: hypothetical protein IJ519_03485 [Clostridia bacterium]|nr:hypothetical protein [Clostridia bacterium]